MAIFNNIFFTLEIIYFVIVFVISVSIITKNRNPVRTLSWLCVIIFVPVIGLILYLIFGREFHRVKVISKKTYDRLQAGPLERIGIKREHIPNSFENLSNTLKNIQHSPVFSNNKIDFFENFDDKFESLLNDIKNAKHHIHLEYYIIEDDKTGERLKNLLIEKSLEGVSVRLIYDSVGSHVTKKRYWKDLENAGVEVGTFLKVNFPWLTSRVNYRNHRKIVVIDGNIGYVGGMNIADRYSNKIDQKVLWIDLHTRIEGDAVLSLQSLFLIDWFFVSGIFVQSPVYFPEIKSIENKLLIQTVGGGPRSDEFARFNAIKQGFVEALFSAKKTIYIQTPYFIPPDYLKSALDTCSLSGVKIHLMIPFRSDMRFVHFASRSYVQELLKIGVKVHFFKGGFLHSKLLIIDDMLTIVGSTNFDVRSFEHNFEVSSFIYDTEVNEKAKRIFMKNLESSSTVSLREWKGRPKLIQFIESICRLFSPLF